MTTLYAQSTGNWDAINWNTAANGSGSNQTPAAGDTLVSNSYTVTVNGNYTVTKVTNTSGGTFTLANGVTLTCTDGTAGVVGDYASVGAVTFALTGVGESATLTAKVAGGNASYKWGVDFTGTKQLTINGSVIGGTANATNTVASGPYGVRLSGSGTLVVSVSPGSNAVKTGSANFAFGIYATTASTITISGDAQSTQVYSSAIYSTGATTITITGNIASSAGINGHAIYLSGASTITINGYVTGSDVVTGSFGVSITSAVSALINGNVYGRLGCGIDNTNGSAVITVNGALYAGTSASAISNNQYGAKLILSGPFICTAANGINPVYSPTWQLPNNPDATYYELRNAALTDSISLYSANHPSAQTGQPTQTDVKAGTVYGPDSEFTGSYVDTLTPTEMADAVWNRLVSDLDTANSIGARLAQAATVPSTGAQIAALGV